MSHPPVELQQRPAIPVAVIRRRAAPAELSRLVPELCGVVWNALRAQQIRSGRHVAIYPGGDAPVEVGAEVAVPFAERDEVVCSNTPGGLVASLTHFGPYQGLGTAHHAIRAWCESNGHRLAGPCWEIYGHWDDTWNANPSQIRTDVFYLVDGQGAGR